MIMKDEEIKRELEKHLLLEAPPGFSDRIMESILAEKRDVKQHKTYTMPGKNLLIILSLFFIGSIVWSFSIGVHSESKFSLFLDRIVPPSLDRINWIFNTLNSYLMVGILLFIVIEIISIRKRSIPITG